MKQHHTASTQNTKFINASPETIYQAFTDPKALATWLAPGQMTGQVHRFDLRVGGGYEMSLFYPPSEQASRGKTSAREDRFTARYVELAPAKKIVQAVNFDSKDPAFAGEMIMEVQFERAGTGTNVIMIFRNLPPGIRPEDNETGTQESLDKLARFVETKA